jgi:hypothetical protein
VLLVGAVAYHLIDKDRDGLIVGDAVSLCVQH